MAGHPHRSGHSARREVAAAATPLELEPTAAPPAARLHRNRLAIAFAATIAALPLLVLDNLPATADTSQDETEEVVARFAPAAALPAVDTTAPSTTVVTATTQATATTVAPAPPTTVERVAAAVAKKVTSTTSPPTTQAPAPPPTYAYGDPADPATWDRMAECESSGNWAANTGNGYYGGLQFSLSTWQHYGGTGYPHQASRATQIQIGQRLQAARGWGAWPGCSRELGYS